MKVKKDIFNMVFEHVIKTNELEVEKYKQYLKLINKHTEGKPKKYTEEQKT